MSAADENEPTETEALADQVEQDRAARAVTVETNRDVRAIALQGETEERRKLINRRMWFLFAGLVLAFLFLAWRTEINSNALRHGLYDACVTRSQTAQEYNLGREALIQLTLSTPNERTPEETAVLVKQLRDGLLLPIEVCGPAP